MKQRREERNVTIRIRQTGSSELCSYQSRVFRNAIKMLPIARLDRATTTGKDEEKVGCRKQKVRYQQQTREYREIDSKPKGRVRGGVIAERRREE